MIKAFKRGTTAVFSDAAWKTGQPQRYGWVEIGSEIEKKKLPQEILEFAEIRKGKRPTLGEIITESADVVKEVGHVIKEGAEFIKDKTLKNAQDVATETKELAKEAKEVKQMIKERKQAKKDEPKKRKPKKKKNDNPE